MFRVTPLFRYVTLELINKKNLLPRLFEESPTKSNFERPFSSLLLASFVRARLVPPRAPHGHRAASGRGYNAGRPRSLRVRPRAADGHNQGVTSPNPTFILDSAEVLGAWTDDDDDRNDVTRWRKECLDR